jgi:tRNA pseudouridine13 synthase
MTDSESLLPPWAYAYGAPDAHASLKVTPEDFIVIEDLGFEPEGDGEHFFVSVTKRHQNTGWVANELAKFAGVRQVDVGYAGLKDRNALTTQFFSINTSGKDAPDWETFDIEGVSINEIKRHPRKLKRGIHRGNSFILTLHDLQGDTKLLEQRLQIIKANGVPNYFGEQRFGFNGNNLNMAQKMFAGEIKVKDRTKRGLYISAVRSYLFNQLLSQRIQLQQWDHFVTGDVPMFNGKSRPIDPDALLQEPERFDLSLCHPSGPLWGAGDLISSGEVRSLEQQLELNHAEYCQALEKQGLKQERRALRMFAEGLNWEFINDNTLQLRFTLVSGGYATSVIRELCVLEV